VSSVCALEKIEIFSSSGVLSPVLVCYRATGQSWQREAMRRLSDKMGRRLFHWTNMTNVQPGDVIFSGYEQRLLIRITPLYAGGATGLFTAVHKIL
jgi:hypothetical protein